jgi:hypothetical protein
MKDPTNHVIDHVSSLARPLFLTHRRIADDVLAQHVLELLRITPVLRISRKLQVPA